MNITVLIWQASENFEHQKQKHETIINNSQNISGLFSSSCIPKTQRFGNWICFRPHMKVGEKTPTQLGPLERANLNQCVLPHLRLRTETDPVSETLCFLEYRTMEKVQKISVNSVQHTPSSESFQVYHNRQFRMIKGN
jgi:hypothetical protein